MKTYYELHVTIEEPLEKAGEVRRAVEDYPGYTWKFSRISDDIVLGPGMKMYATTHINESLGESYCILCLDYLRDFLISKGYNVVRAKIEHVILDKLKGRDF